ncbi:hypothetical protein FIU82_05190 [Pseudoalteromonas sp. THAF3]|uniref:Porin family protein n=1 Tax=Pseudoalteromonas ruthenica TaxID=151081 RepID=A0A0F4PZ67_9GAMM|nr:MULTISPECIES: outer membrane beta-barrel protein [Pseudoalteromonas]KJZ00776.1 hypothetical protein TW76_00755 [Pseudoalteromonas ruthenica]KJZ01171.1 hypothetical protein TW72_04850 [Pseudoalteromonas ruthenica]MCF2863048.1 porin family protein [Pseudoalteromonas sp. CNAT2-18]MCG7543076.1 porin family protein [Pseudoalteromonas sp. MM17-2]MCG7559200.1 porin family protein [Pseudoalteromonas sp. CNAT2-18.1]|tara:strand:- start:842 stop:1354 length:513 start_codon:yes stop_codon:yes gene_type:complete
MKKQLLCLGLALACNYAHANEYYIGADYLQLSTDFDGNSASPTVNNIKLGAELYNGIFLELQGGVSSSDDDLLGVTTDIDQNYSAFFRFRSPNYDGFSVDLALGYARTEVLFSGKPSVYDGLEEFSGFAWGGRVNYDLPYNFRINADYQQRYNKDDILIDAWGVGLSYVF